ncbi:hypothetical protein BDY19DRAFT_952129 [Irpex rosettiformis]|uniref:Uncharacterized protein n=1 Tax=Irpex rosettiformis TaxID=378272 RepID=A0ACB8U1F8_9APHY|nr:hypothetical protein BDY19DRAFT_952129 [Irpex rosettiformis]
MSAVYLCIMIASLQHNSIDATLPKCIDLDESNIVAEIHRYNNIPSLPRSEADCPYGLRISGTKKYWQKPAGFEEFTQRFATTITIVYLQDLRFKCFSDFIDLVILFPFVLKLRIWECHWDNDNLELWGHCSKMRSAPVNCCCGGPQMPLGIRHFTANLLESTSPVPLAKWFNHGCSIRKSVHVELHLRYYMSLRSSAAAIIESLSILGKDLSVLTLVPLYKPSEYPIRFITFSLPAYNPYISLSIDSEVDHRMVGTPSLSLNTKLESFSLLNITPAYCPARYVSSILSSIKSNSLKRLKVGPPPKRSHYGCQAWHRFDVAELNQVLSSLLYRLPQVEIDIYLGKESTFEDTKGLNAAVYPQTRPGLLVQSSEQTLKGVEAVVY